VALTEIGAKIGTGSRPLCRDLIAHADHFAGSPERPAPIADSSYTSVQLFSEPLIEIHPMFTDFQSQG
jgi:hypothetical protein